jgi:hypothetical protein
LIFAGAVERHIVNATDGHFPPILPAGDAPTSVGVHRLYFGTLEPGLSQLTVKQHYDAILNRVRTYLKDMDVAPEFLSFMQSIDPESMHLMTNDELKHYALGWLDVVYAERRTAYQASIRGITSVEWRKRQQESFAAAAGANDDCKNVMVAPTDYDRAEAALHVMTLKAQLISDCAGAIEAGVSIEVYQERASRAVDFCKRFENPEDSSNCYERYLATGRASP